MRRRWPIALAAAIGAHACVSLEEVTLDICGNRVIDKRRGERCDGFNEHPSSHCALPGDPNECRYVCESAQGEAYLCPPGWGCGPDKVCRAHAGSFGEPVAVDIGGGYWAAAADVDGDGVADVLTQRTSQVAVDFIEDGRSVERFEVPLAVFDKASVADLDGDGRTELLTPTYLGLTVLKGNAQREPQPMSHPGVLRPDEEIAFVDANLVPDVVPHGMSALSGVGREPALLTDGTETIIISSRVFSPTLFDFGVEGLLQPLPTGSFDTALVDVPSASVGLSPEQVILPSIGDNKLSLMRPAYRVVDPDGNGPIPDQIEVSMLCVGNGNSLCLGPNTIALDPPAALTTRTFAVHLNREVAPSTSAIPCGGGVMARGDAHLDLLVQTDLGIYVAYGLGDSHFHGHACELDEIALGTITGDDTARPGASPDGIYTGCLDYSDVMNPVPLEVWAVEDIDVDGIVDLVTRSALIMSRWAVDLEASGLCGVGSPMLVPAFSDSWLDARIVDIDGDADHDIVASTEQAGIDVIRWSDGLPTITKVSTDAVVREGSVGDFDADGVDDVAFVQPAGAGARDAVTVLFGEPFAPPGQPVQIAVFDELNGVLSSTVEDAIVGFPDGTSDLLVSVGHGDTASAAILQGRSDRLLHSPFLPQYGQNAEERYIPISGAVVSLGDDRQDLVTYGGEFLPSGVIAGLGLSRAQLTDDGDPVLFPTAPYEGLDLGDGPVELGHPFFDFFAPKLVPLAVGDEGPDRLAFLWMEQVPNRKTSLALMPMIEDGVGFADPSGVAVFEGATIASRIPLSILPVSRTIEQASAVVHADPVGCRLSGDDDALVLMLIREEQCEAEADSPALTVVPSSALADFDADPNGVVSQARDVTFLREGETLLSFGCANVDPDPEEEIVFITMSPGLPPCGSAKNWIPETVYAYSVGITDGELEQPVEVGVIEQEQLPSLGSSDQEGPPASSVIVGDFDGDGVNDMMIGGPSSSVLLRGEVRPP